jgi:general stress protein YciG
VSPFIPPISSASASLCEAGRRRSTLRAHARRFQKEHARRMTTQKKSRGFGAMDREKQREIASRGGKAAHAQGRAHEFTSEEARDAGRKGGEAISRDLEHMAEIGKKGGEARARKLTTEPNNPDGAS